MRIKELDWSDVPDAVVTIFIGRRKSGKSVNILDTFYQKRNVFSHGLVFCGSKSTIKDYEKHFPSTFIYYGYHSDVVGKMIDKQEQDVEMGIAKPVFILVDDCMWAKKSILTDPNIRRIFMNGRHSLIFFVLSMQYCMDLVPALRQQIDYTFLSREKNPQNREKLYKNYNVCFGKAEEFEFAMQQCTQDHQTFVLNNGESESDRPEDNVNWWKSVYAPGGRKCNAPCVNGSAYCRFCKPLHPRLRPSNERLCTAPYKVSPKRSWWRYHKKKFNPMHFMPSESKAEGVMTITKLVKRIPPVVDASPIAKLECAAMAQRVRENMRPAISSTLTSQGAAWIKSQRDSNIGPRRRGFTIKR
jgi:hypothetical protein